MQRGCPRAAACAAAAARTRTAAARAPRLAAAAAAAPRAAPHHAPPPQQPPPRAASLRCSARHARGGAAHARARAPPPSAAAHASGAAAASSSASAPPHEVSLSLPSFGADAAQYDALMADMAAFLVADLGHLFDDTGIDASRYEANMARAQKRTKHARKTRAKQKMPASRADAPALPRSRPHPRPMCVPAFCRSLRTR
jgi:hypothetical protein